MSKNDIKQFLKIIGVVLCALAVGTVALFFKISSDDSVIKKASSYVKEYSKDGDKFKATLTYDVDGESVEKTYTYDSEPYVGQTEVVYYVKNKAGVLYDKKDDVNLYKANYGILGVAAAFAVAALLSFAGSTSIRKRKNIKVAKKIKVDDKSLYRK